VLKIKDIEIDKHVKGILNKLTASNFNTLSQDLLEIKNAYLEECYQRLIANLIIDTVFYVILLHIKDQF
jgi:hypothetical protein